MLRFQISEFEPQKTAYFFTRCAVRALYCELSLFPKPGLVSFNDSGAHHDMDGLLFYKSLVSLRHYFYKLCINSMRGDDLSALVDLGKQAESHMLTITGGINTHRGAIFALGILCSTLSRLSTYKCIITLDDLQQSMIEVWGEFLLNHHKNNPDSNGNRVIKSYSLVGAKQMAIDGYAIVFDVFKELHPKYSSDFVSFGLRAYCLLLLQMDDTNVMHRVGMNGLIYARKEVSKLLNNNKEQFIEQANKLHIIFSTKNISPGGVADMLGFLYCLNHIFEKT